MAQKMNFGDDITSQLRLAKKKHFAQQESKRIKEESDLQVNTIENTDVRFDIKQYPHFADLLETVDPGRP